MKTTAHDIRYHNREQFLSEPYIRRNTADVKADRVNFVKKDGVYTLQVDMHLLKKDNYRIFLKGNTLSLILFEEKQLSRPVHLHHFNMHSFDSLDYEIMKTVEFCLPGGHFYLIKHYFVPQQNRLNILLGKVS